MAYQMLYPDEKPEVNRHSSIDQFYGFLSAYKQGGWAPIVFDQLDGITCETIKTHPVIISFGGDIGYTFPEAHCAYMSDKIIYYKKEGVETLPLPDFMGGKGETYEHYTCQNAFIGFDSNDLLGTHSEYKLRSGLDYSLADESLPPVE